MYPSQHDGGIAAKTGLHFMLHLRDPTPTSLGTGLKLLVARLVETSSSTWSQQPKAPGISLQKRAPQRCHILRCKARKARLLCSAAVIIHDACSHRQRVSVAVMISTRRQSKTTGCARTSQCLVAATSYGQTMPNLFLGWTVAGLR